MKFKYCFYLFFFVCFSNQVQAQHKQYISSITEWMTFDWFKALNHEIKEGTIADEQKMQRWTLYSRKAIAYFNVPQKQITLYRYLGSFYYHKGDFSKALHYYNKSSEFATFFNRVHDLIVNEIRITFIKYADNLSVAEQDFNDLLESAENINYAPAMIEALNGLAIISEDRQQLTEAFEKYHKALMLAEQQGLFSHMAKMRNNLGLVRYSKGDLSGAMHDFEEGLKIVNAAEDEWMSFNFLNNIGLIHLKKGEIENAIAVYEEAINWINRENGSDHYKALAYINLTWALLENKALDDADFYLTKLAELAQSIPSQSVEAKTHLLRGFYFKQKEAYQHAIAAYENGLQIALELYFLESDLYDDVMDAKLQLSSIYRQTNQLEKALKTYEHYMQIKDSVFNIELDKKINALAIAYENDQIKIELLNERNKLTLLEIAQQERKSRINIFIASLVAVFLTIVLIIRNRQQKRFKRSQQLFNLQLLQNIDSERSRIAKDLHDDLGQSLSFIKSKINLKNRAQNINWAANEQEELNRDLDNMIQKMREISHNLFPTHLEKLGLRASLIHLLSEAEKNTGIFTSHDISLKAEQLPKEVQFQLYRITQEAINNALKHANASSLKVVLNRDKNRMSWHWKLMDNGSNLIKQSAKNKSFGIGLKTINQRAKSIDGNLEILEGVQGGNVLEVKFSVITND